MNVVQLNFCRIGNKYRERGGTAIANMSSRNVSSDRRAKLGIDRRRSASAVTSSRKTTRSPKDGGSVKRCATKSRDTRERLLLPSRQGDKSDETARHKDLLFTDEKSVAAGATSNDLIYMLRKEIQEWRASGRSTNEVERERPNDVVVTNSEIERNVSQGKEE